jgi:hypothetical protein
MEVVSRCAGQVITLAPVITSGNTSPQQSGTRYPDIPSRDLTPPILPDQQLQLCAKDVPLPADG